MTQEIKEIGVDVALEEFENYYEVKDNYYLLKSYFFRQSAGESFCQWHLGKMNEEGTSFNIMKRLGSCHIEDEDRLIKMHFETLVKQFNSENI